jgi:hypothetical protein
MRVWLQRRKKTQPHGRRTCEFKNLDSLKNGDMKELSLEISRKSKAWEWGSLGRGREGQRRRKIIMGWLFSVPQGLKAEDWAPAVTLLGGYRSFRNGA